jgi:hypothetical protein
MSELVGNISNNIMKKNKKNLYFSWVFFNIIKHLIIKLNQGWILTFPKLILLFLF